MPQSTTYARIIDELLGPDSDGTQGRQSQRWKAARKILIGSHPIRFSSGPASVTMKEKSASACWIVDGHRTTLQLEIRIAEFLLPHIAGAPPDQDGKALRPAESFLKIENGIITDVILLYI
jgi:hypothetical protein